MLQKLKETRLHDTNLLALLRFECAQNIRMSNVYVVFALKLFLPSTARMEGSWTTFQDVLASWFTNILINLLTDFFFVVANFNNKMKKKHPLQSGIKLLNSSLVTAHVVLSKPAVVHSDSAGGCDGYNWHVNMTYKWQMCLIFFCLVFKKMSSNHSFIHLFSAIYVGPGGKGSSLRVFLCSLNVTPSCGMHHSIWGALAGRAPLDIWNLAIAWHECTIVSVFIAILKILQHKSSETYRYSEEDVARVRKLETLREKNTLGEVFSWLLLFLHQRSCGGIVCVATPVVQENTAAAYDVWCHTGTLSRDLYLDPPSHSFFL